VGRTTSGAFGHTLGCAIALGYIRIAEQGLDVMLSTGGFKIEIACRCFPAQATLEAAYDSENLKPRM
jgi:glycine cleavage system aminomethyltransferase T